MNKNKKHNGINVLEKIKKHSEDFKLERISLAPEKKEFPVDAFPGIIPDLINDFHDKYGFPSEFLGAGVLSCFASSMGNNFRLQVKGKWVEAPILWNCIVGDSGTAKTPSLKSIMSPLYDYQKKQFAYYEEDMSEWNANQAAAKNSNSTNSDPKPVLNQLIIQDTTLEALCVVHKYNKRGLLQVSDELIGWINSMNQYRRGNDAQRWLEIYNNGNIIINRMTREDVLLENACVNVIGGIQHKIITELVKENRDKDGFLYRILFFIPEGYSPAPFMTGDVDEGLFSLYEDAVHRIIDNTHQFKLIFSQEARKEFGKWYDGNAHQMKISNDPTRREIYSKLSGQLVRLVIVIHGMKYSMDMAKDAEKISQDTVKRAISLIEYFRYTSCKISDTLDVISDPRIEKVAEMVKEGITYRSVVQKVGVSMGTISKWKKKYPKLFKTENDE